MSPWTNVLKPTSSVWTAVNPQGKEQYDQSDIEYDDADIYYDGENPNQYTKVAKPTSSVWTKISKPS